MKGLLEEGHMTLLTRMSYSRTVAERNTRFVSHGHCIREALATIQTYEASQPELQDQCPPTLD